MGFPASEKHVATRCVLWPCGTWRWILGSRGGSKTQRRCSDFRRRGSCFPWKSYRNALDEWRDRNSTNLHWYILDCTGIFWYAPKTGPTPNSASWCEMLCIQEAQAIFWRSNAINNGHTWPYMAVLTSTKECPSGMSCLDLWCTVANSCWFVLFGILAMSSCCTAQLQSSNSRTWGLSSTWWKHAGLTFQDLQIIYQVMVHGWSNGAGHFQGSKQDIDGEWWRYNLSGQTSNQRTKRASFVNQIAGTSG